MLKKPTVAQVQERELKTLRAKERIQKGFYTKLFDNTVVTYGPREAIILAHLLQMERTVNAKYRRDGMFYCSNTKLRKIYGFPKSTLDLVFKNLKEKGAIVCVRKGLPPRRYIAIEWDSVATVIYGTNY